MSEKLFLICRIAILCLGVLALPDAFLPTKNSLQEVDKLSKVNSRAGDYYAVIFKDSPRECEADIQTLNKLKPNEILRVYRTQLWNECVKLERDDVEVYRDSYWRLTILIVFGVSIVVGMGWIDLRYWWKF